MGQDAWLETRGDTIVVHCNNSDAVYHLFCDGSQWVGDEKNCTSGNGTLIIYISDKTYNI